MDFPILALAFLAAAAAGLVNAVAGGGTLLSFPALVALGISPVAANVTNTIALCPGYLGGALAQRRELSGQRRRLATVLAISVPGGLAGAWLLLRSGERMFGAVVPYLLLAASLWLALRPLLERRAPAADGRRGAWALLALAAVYGGYFGAGASVVVLAVLEGIYADSLTRLNFLKQAAAFSIHLSAALYFALAVPVHWTLVLAMACGSAAGGWAGGRLAERIRPAALRWTAVAIGLAAALVLLLKQA